MFRRRRGKKEFGNDEQHTYSTRWPLGAWDMSTSYLRGLLGRWDNQGPPVSLTARRWRECSKKRRLPGCLMGTDLELQREQWKSSGRAGKGWIRLSDELRDSGMSVRC